MLGLIWTQCLTATGFMESMQLLLIQLKTKLNTERKSMSLDLPNIFSDNHERTKFCAKPSNVTQLKSVIEEFDLLVAPEEKSASPEHQHPNHLHSFVATQPMVVDIFTELWSK